MPVQQEQMYCSHQINIPAELPDILKQYTKAAIRTQPRDLLVWSAAYFRALSRGEKPPVKDRLEFPQGKTGLSVGLLRVLHKQLGEYKTVPVIQLSRRWDGLCLDPVQLQDLLQLGHFQQHVDWLRFLGLACSSIGKDIQESMQVFCEVVTSDPEGGAARIPYGLYAEMLIYLSKKDNTINRQQIDKVLAYLKNYSEKQEGMVAPRNLIQRDCPKLIV